MSVNFRGQDLVDGLREALKEDIKNTRSDFRELGRFLFGVGTASLGLVSTLATFAGLAGLDWAFVLALGFFGTSMVIAIWMAIPRVKNLTGETNLIDAHNELVDQSIFLVVMWAFAWTLGTLFGVMSLFVI